MNCRGAWGIFQCKLLGSPGVSTLERLPGGQSTVGMGVLNGIFHMGSAPTELLQVGRGVLDVVEPQNGLDWKEP